MRTRGTTPARLAWGLLLTLGLAVSAASAQAPPPPPEEPAPPASPESPREEDWGHHQGGDVSFGGTIVVGPGEVRHGDVTCIGGGAVIEGTVYGAVTVIAGRLDLAGSVDGDVTAVASRTTVRDGARVSGDLVNVAGPMRRGDAIVGGDVVDVGVGIPMPGLGWLGFVSSFFLYWTVLELFLVFLTLLLVSALVPERVQFISEEATVRWPGALMAGIGGYAALVIVMFLLFVTVLGIPLMLLLWCVFFVFKTLALAGIFHLVGSRLGRTLGREMSLLGAVLLGFLPFALVRLVFSVLGLPLSFLGWLAVWMPLQIVAVGLMVLTRGGGRRPALPAPLVPAVPAAPPPPAAPERTVGP